MKPLPYDLLDQLRRTAREVPLRKLRRSWLENTGAREAWLPACLEAECERAISDDGDFEAAIELARIGESLSVTCGYPAHEFRRLRALAFARSGNTAAAIENLERLIEGVEGGALSYGLIARTYRDLAMASDAAEDRASLFLKAADWSERGVCDTPPSETLEDYTRRAYLANQVAQFSFLGGDPERSRRFREEVFSIYETIRTSGKRWFPLDPETEFWWLTNLAEMALLEGKLDVATDNYRRMRSLGDDLLGHVVANAKVCRLLLAGLGRGPHELDPVFELPSILVFSGPGFDPPGQEAPHFPASRANAMKSILGSHLARLDCFEGFVSMLGGADLLFAEALLDRGGRLKMVLPFSLAETRRRIFEPLGREWSDRFDRAVEKAHQVDESEEAGNSGIPVAPDETVPRQNKPDQSDAPIAAGSRMLATARKRAAELGLDLQPLVVSDEANSGNQSMPPRSQREDFATLCRNFGLSVSTVPLPRT